MLLLSLVRIAILQVVRTEHRVELARRSVKLLCGSRATAEVAEVLRPTPRG
jgi:hypothetical protein